MRKGLKEEGRRRRKERGKGRNRGRKGRGEGESKEKARHIKTRKQERNVVWVGIAKREMRQ